MGLGFMLWLIISTQKLSVPGGGISILQVLAFCATGLGLALISLAFYQIVNEAKIERLSSTNPRGFPGLEASNFCEADSHTSASSDTVDMDADSVAKMTSAPVTWSKEVFGIIEWRRYEALVETLFKQAGFHTASKSHGADGGIDIWLSMPSDTKKPIGFVQCKHWKNKPVGVEKIREFFGVMAASQIKRGHFATTSRFTADAKAFALQNGINLIDTEALLRLIEKRTGQQQAQLLAIALEGDYSRPTCVQCGVKMVTRKPRNGSKQFWGCSSFPKCRHTMQISQPQNSLS